MTKTQILLAQNFKNLDLKFNYDLGQKSYFKIGGKAEVYLELADKEQIIKLIKFIKKNEIKLIIIGGLSNVIIDDAGVKGVVLKLINNKIKKINKNIIQADSGIKMALLVKQSLDFGLTGLENFLGVPGNLGGAVYNNAHYLNDLLSDYISRVEIINSDGEIKWLDKKQCQFAYDKSRFQQTGEIILSVEFALKTGDKINSQNKIKAAQQYRAKTQPLGKPSSGCIFQNIKNNKNLKKLFPQFKNQEYISAGFIIDKAGLKGLKIGDLEVSSKHAAFIVNNNHGTSSDLKKLINKIKKIIKNKFKINLQEEVIYLS